MTGSSPHTLGADRRDESAESTDQPRQGKSYKHPSLLCRRSACVTEYRLTSDVACAGELSPREEEYVPRHVYLQPDAPDPILPDELVLALANRHAPAERVQAVEESGGEARTYLIDDELILKVQRPQQLRPLTSLAKEVFFLRQLEELPSECRVSVPRVVGHGTSESGVQYTLLTRMPGRALRRTTLTAAVRREALIDLGRTLRRIHSQPVEPFIASGILPGDLSFMDTMTRVAEPLLDRAREVRERGMAWTFPLSIEKIVGRALSSLPHSRERAALHSNPFEEHTFVDPETGAFTGLIDFGDAYISHPALEIRRWNQPADRDAILIGYQESGSVSDEWLAIWRALMIVADVDTMVRVPDRADAARQDLESLLSEI